MDSFNFGYIALAFVGALFFGLQAWWIGMTIRNGKTEKTLLNKKHTNEVKETLERIFRS